MAPRELVPGIPETLERLILRCLRKEPERRFQQMSDVKVELEEAKEESDSQARASAGVAVSKRRSGRRWTLWAVAVSIPAVAAAVALWAGRPALPPPSVVQLTSERWAGAGSFSPDGTQIAYASAGDDGANWDIWIKIVGETEARRLTTDALADGYPAWSPDGTQIAFLRLSTGSSRGDLAWWSHSGAVHLVSPQGGPERRLSEWPARLQLSWSPDGRWLAVSKARSGSDPPGGIHLVSVSSGETRAVTFPQPPAFDFSPSFSPNGRELAYASCKGAEGYPVCEVSLLSLDGELRPQGAARSLTGQGLSNRGLAWTRDGRSIVYGADDRLWRVRADGGAPPERLEIVARGAFPSTLGSRDRLAFTRETVDSDIYRLDLGGSAVPLVQSTFVEARPQYSPDGRRIAFDSAPGAGHGAEIWLADADGSNPARLTRGPGRFQGSPHWSPDGRVIAFDSRAESGRVDIWTIGVSGSGLRQITHDPADEVVPSFSRDGRFIYFASNRTGRFELGRVAADGGREEQVTHEGGVLPIESFDGRTLYYLRSENGALLSRPTAGGGEHMIRPCVVTWGWAVGPRGLFHEDCGGLDAAVSAQRSLRYWDAVTGQDRLVATLDTDVINGLSVSPEGGSIVFGRDRETSDLMMIENFR
jgi:Tol biopolymer transport system component